ncbi:hypothetical protein PI124_g18310 [Phytophthora idaei]|nr:hypothetical protein PI125_g19073 [Phytophthora idaei]KAG3136810.1 hypothetical protein PI126_g17650 [Phytophthora idaei]KAG3236680.1 hypothetical protein PI124_g18310 [Phytophthora idaei]
MLQLYHRTRPQIKTVGAVEELEPTGPSHRKFLALLEYMKMFQSVSKKLQCGTIDLADVRLLFDSAVEGYPCMRDQLKPNAKIVHSPVFESAVVKVINGGAMANAEAAAVKRFEVPRCESKRKAREEDYATQILLAGTSQCAKMVEVSMASRIALLKKLPSTSKCVRATFFRSVSSCLLPSVHVCCLRILSS